MGSMNYKLIDCGNFRKLEKIGEYTVVRPSPAAVWAPAKASLWNSIDAEFVRFKDGNGEWKLHNKNLPEDILIQFALFQMKVKRTGFGHFGFFAEQEVNWLRLHSLIESSALQSFNVLNLFAYTGGATLACAKAGAFVTHVDASKTSVSWARENAEINQIERDSIRWMVEDVDLFVEREARRGNYYQGVILDPPSYGRGPKNQVWKIEESLVPLLTKIKSILAGDLQFILLSSHSPGYTPEALKNLLLSISNSESMTYEAQEMLISSESGVKLPSGASCFMIKK